MRVGIIGAGMAGLACAEVLLDQGLDVCLFDKGRGPGGRMSTRRVPTPFGEASFDHGAQYFTARDPAFLEVVQDWEKRGLVAPWLTVDDAAWVGVPAMSSIIRDLARRHQVAFEKHVQSIVERGGKWHFQFKEGTAGPFDVAIVAVPAEQAATLLSLQDFDMARIAVCARSKPCWTGLFAFQEQLAARQDILRDRGIIAWAARNGSKPGRKGPESWVVQAQPSWSEDHGEADAEVICDALLHALGSALGERLPEPIIATAHRWRFAMSNGTGDLALWNPTKRLGACGDWLQGPRVESAWLSGHRLGQRIGETVNKATAAAMHE